MVPVKHGACKSSALVLVMKLFVLGEEQCNDHQCHCRKTTLPFIYMLFCLEKGTVENDVTIKTSGLTYHMINCTL